MPDVVKLQGNEAQFTAGKVVRLKGVTGTTTSNKKQKQAESKRVRMVWVVFDNSMHEIQRLPYAEKNRAEAIAEFMQAHDRTGMKYHIQAVKEGQTPMQFGQEVLSLDDKDRKEFYDMLVAQGIDCDPPTPKVKK